MFHGYKRFTAYKRTLDGQVFKLGIVSAANKTTADTRTRYLYGRLLVHGEACWAEETDEEEAA